MFSSQLTSVVVSLTPSTSTALPSSSISPYASGPSPPSSDIAIESSLTTLCETVESQLATVVKVRKMPEHFKKQKK